MGRKRDLSPRKIAVVEALLEEKRYSQREIAAKIQISQKSVSRISKSMDARVSYSQSRVGKCGRKKKITQRLERKLINLSVRNRKATSTELKNQLHSYGVDVTSRTVRRKLCEAGLNARRPRKKAKITPSMRKKRLVWAKEHENKSVEEWSKICFSDESIFTVSEETAQYVRRRTGEAFNTNCVQQNVKHPVSVMIWSVISVHGPGSIYIVNGTMRQDQYLTVLENHLIPQIRDWFPDQDCIFMQDGAPCHKAKKVTNFLAEKNIKVLSWPGNSPDMNPIENLWAIVKRKIKHQTITTRNSLIEILKEIWSNDPEIKRLCKILIEGMPARIKNLKLNNGMHTKY